MEFKELEGKVLTSFETSIFNSILGLTFNDMDVYHIHSPDNGSVRIDRIEGNWADIIGVPITSARKTALEIKAGENSGMASATYTGCTLETDRGKVVIHWHGYPNGDGTLGEPILELHKRGKVARKRLTEQQKEFMESIFQDNFWEGIDEIFKEFKTEIKQNGMGKSYRMEEDFRYIQHKIESEGFDYCFRDYSSFSDIEDEEFHKLREQYKKAANRLERYVEAKAEAEDEKARRDMKADIKDIIGKVVHACVVHACKAGKQPDTIEFAFDDGYALTMEAGRGTAMKLFGNLDDIVGSPITLAEEEGGSGEATYRICAGGECIRVYWYGYGGHKLRMGHVAESFAQSLLSKSEDMEGEFIKAVDEDFWGLIGTDSEAEEPPKGFGQALDALKEGLKARRASWDADEFIFLMPAGRIPRSAIRDPLLKGVLDRSGKDYFEGMGSIRMKASDDTIVTGWVPGQVDMLAEDWYVFP